MPALFPGVSDSLNIRLLAAGYLDVGAWWTQTDLLRDFWRLYLNDEDGAALQLADRRFELPAGQIVVIPPSIEFEPVLSHPVHQLYSHFEVVGWPAEAAREILPEPVVLPPDPLRDELVRQLRKEIAEAKEGLEPILASRLKALIHLAVSCALSSIPDDQARRFLRIAEGQQELLAVLHYIDEHIDQPLSNSRLAEIALASESRFIRRFREATGRTPGRYVQDRRLRKAAELLVSTDHSIDQIAETCGFANRYYFTRVFAQRMGCPPARYRSDRPYLKRA